MKKVNALELRQSLSKIIKLLEKNGEPILLEKGRKPAAVLISLEDFQQRFVEKAAEEKRLQILVDIKNLRRTSKDQTAAEDILRDIRAG